MRKMIRFLLPAGLAAIFAVTALTPKSASAGLAWMDDDGGATLSAQGIKAKLSNQTTPPLVIEVSSGFFTPNNIGKLTIRVIDDVNGQGTPSTIGGMQFKLDLAELVGIAGLQIQLIPHPNFSTSIPVVTNPVDVQNGFVTPPQSIFVAIGPATGGNAFSVDADILQLCFSIPQGQENTLLGLDNEIRVSEMELLVSDDLGNEIPVTLPLIPGLLQIGEPCDVNTDGNVDIRDAVVWVARFLSKTGFDALPIKSATTDDIDGSTDSQILDGNGDLKLTVADVVAIVLKILGLDLPVTKALVSGPAVIDLGAVTTIENGQLAIPVYLDAPGNMSAASVAFSFDPSIMKIGTPVLPDGSGQLGFDSQITEDGTLRAIIYSLSTEVGLATGNTPLMYIPVTLLGESDVSVTLTDFTLANNQAQTYPVELGTTSQTFNKSAQTPTSFALMNNSPNPFNPSTSIAYEVPQQAHITLTIYNVLGQEVIRLVDQVQVAGQYEVAWNASNARGGRVSSGVYLYSIASSSGFSETKRMTLLK